MKKVIFPILFFLVNAFACYGQLFFKVEQNRKYGMLDATGKEFIPLLYSDVGYPVQNRIYANKDGKEKDYKTVGGTWGYFDTLGTLVIPFQFQDADEFSESLAPVKLNGNWGYIDLTGKIVIPCRFEETRSFSEGIAAVKINNKWGFIDKTGKIIVQPLFDRAEKFHCNRAVVFYKTKEYWAKDEDNERYKEEEGWHAVIDRNGKVLTQKKYDYISSFSEGFSTVSLNAKEGVIDSLGNEVVPLIYSSVRDFSEGLAAASIYIERPSDYNFGITKKQKDSLTAAFEKLFLTSSKKNDKAKIKGLEAKMDSLQGTSLLSMLFLANAQEPSEKITYGYVNTKGEVIIPFQFDHAEEFKNGKAIVQKGEQVLFGFYSSDSTKEFEAGSGLNGLNFITKNGTILLKDYYRIINKEVEGNYVMYNNYGAGAYDSTFKNIIPHKYTNLHYLGKGYYKAMLRNDENDHYRIINSEGKIISNEFYSTIYLLSKGFLVKSPDFKSYALLDLEGKLVRKLPYTDVFLMR